MKAFSALTVVLLLVGSAATWAYQDAGSSENGKAQNSNTESATPTDQNQPAGTTAAAPSTPENPAPPKPPAARSGHASRKRAAKKQLPQGEEEPRKIVVHRGGINEPMVQLIPGMTAQEASHQRQQTEDLLTAAASDLKKLAGRELNSSQQETVSQIQHYVDVARAALNEGDIRRAHTLAQKAQLLSDDLVRR